MRFSDIGDFGRAAGFHFCTVNAKDCLGYKMYNEQQRDTRSLYRELIIKSNRTAFAGHVSGIYIYIYVCVYVYTTLFCLSENVCAFRAGYITVIKDI